MPDSRNVTLAPDPPAPTLAGAFHLPTKVRFGRGSRSALAAEVGGRRCLLLTSASGRARSEADAVLGPTLTGLDAAWLAEVPANPTAAQLDTLVERARDRGWSDRTVIAIGGGSVLDAAKALLAGLAVDGVGVADIARRPSVLDGSVLPPLVALPTTSGSGSEVTPVAVLWHRTPGGGPRPVGVDGPAKVSLTHPSLFPALAIVDPALSDGLPAHHTLATALDAFNQAAESIWNRHANAVTLPLAVRAMALVWHALPVAMRGDGHAEARDRLAEASLLAGTALGQTRTVACHALSYPLTDRYGVTHGVACAFTMPAVAHHMLPADDGRLAALSAALLGHRVPVEGLPAALAAFLEELGVVREVRRAVGSLDALLALLPEVELPERGCNGLRDVGRAAREAILAAAWAGAPAA